MKRKWILTPVMAVLFLLGFGVAVLYFAPLATCPWCSGEIKHYGGLKRHCDGDDMGCDGSGKTSCFWRWNSLVDYRLYIMGRR